MTEQNRFKFITEKSKRWLAIDKERRPKFTSLYHHINEKNLASCFKELNANSACGIDGETVKTYGENLEANIADLVVRLKNKTYEPQPVRRVLIPNPGKAEMRPLGIPCVEDKLVQQVAKEILEAIFEPMFYSSSHGYRPGKSCHTAIKVLNKNVMAKPTNYIVEVDIAKFFDTVDHAWLMICLKERINDPNLLWLIHKILKAGIMEGGAYKASDEGTPQGGVISPILANIYLHYVLDMWYKVQIKSIIKSYTEIIRYCDDVVGLFESKNDAETFLNKLEVRLAKFGLKLSKDKTRILKFGRQAWKEAKRKDCKVETFDFLGFTHICATSRNGYFYLQHQTSSHRLSAALNKTKVWLKKARGIISLKEIMDLVKKKLIGHYNHYGVNGNHRKLVKYYKGTCKLVYKWINRRGKKSLSFASFKQYLMWNPLPVPTIRVQIWEPRTNVS